MIAGLLWTIAGLSPELGILDGLHGLVVCGLQAFGSFLKYARLWDYNERARAGEETVSRRTNVRCGWFCYFDGEQLRLDLLSKDFDAQARRVPRSGPAFTPAIGSSP